MKTISKSAKRAVDNLKREVPWFERIFNFVGNVFRGYARARRERRRTNWMRIIRRTALGRTYEKVLGRIAKPFNNSRRRRMRMRRWRSKKMSRWSGGKTSMYSHVKKTTTKLKKKTKSELEMNTNCNGGFKK